jgi:hypothetical protein
MKKWLFNPFVYIAGTRALTLGLAAMIITAVISYFSTAHFNGVLDVHAGFRARMALYFLEQLNARGWSVVLFYLSAVIFSRSSIRFIDMAGTMALARWPMIFSTLICFAVNTGVQVHGPEDITVSFIVTASVLLLFTIWMVALMYNAFTVSANLRGGIAAAAFITALIIAEVASVTTHYMFFKYFLS